MRRIHAWCRYIRILFNLLNNTSKTDHVVNLTDVIPDKLKLISYTIQNSSDVSTKQITNFNCYNSTNIKINDNN